jgi:3-methyladenine DNA glycosylase AlkD
VKTHFWAQSVIEVMPPNLTSLRQSFRAQASTRVAETATRFFKTGPGDYADGDRFLGIKVPVTRSFLPQSDALTEAEIVELLHSEWHEERLLAVLILARRFSKAKRDETAREHIVNLYLENTRWVNNWDLVDSSASHILGDWLLLRDRKVLMKLARSDSLWEQRISIIATHAFIRVGEFDETCLLCEKFLTHKHDLMHKACGWMLREMGKADESALALFLDKHAKQMPRTMLRYAIEKLTPAQRSYYMA